MNPDGNMKYISEELYISQLAEKIAKEYSPDFEGWEDDGCNCSGQTYQRKRLGCVVMSSLCNCQLIMAAFRQAGRKYIKD